MDVELVATGRVDRKLQTFRRIQEEALRLFLEKGFGQTTVEEVAAAAGVSHMTVFRHFATKEALVVTDEFDYQMPAMIRSRPPEEPPAEALVNAFRQMLTQLTPEDWDRALKRMRLIISVPALNGAMWAHWMTSQDAATEALAEREGPEADVYRLRVIVAAVVGVGLSAAYTWAASDGERDLNELIDQSIATLRDAFC